MGEEALLPPDSVSWRIFKNPIALFIGGMAAVILELAEPSVRAGVWEHSSFRKDPVGRLQRTGLAAIVTVYGARSIAEPMIAEVVRMHAKVAGEAGFDNYSHGVASLVNEMPVNHSSDLRRRMFQNTVSPTVWTAFLHGAQRPLSAYRNDSGDLCALLADRWHVWMWLRAVLLITAAEKGTRYRFRRTWTVT
jgi:hypothetical protein